MNTSSEVSTHSSASTATPQDETLRLRMSSAQRVLKRAFDFVVSFFALVILSPIFLAIIIALTIGGGHVFYCQERLGYHGKPFHIIKFRSMKSTAESDGPQLAAPNDDRLTRIGRFLRHHHLDELPQLWNVLVGDMSVVGPRPERQYFIEQIMQHDSRYKYLFQVRPGLTSEATIDNGYTSTMEKMLTRLEIDLRYLSKASFGYDLRLIFRTMSLMVKGD